MLSNNSARDLKVLQLVVDRVLLVFRNNQDELVPVPNRIICQIIKSPLGNQLILLTTDLRSMNGQSVNKPLQEVSKNRVYLAERDCLLDRVIASWISIVDNQPSIAFTALDKLMAIINLPFQPTISFGLHDILSEFDSRGHKRFSFGNNGLRLQRNVKFAGVGIGPSQETLLHDTADRFRQGCWLHSSLLDHVLLLERKRGLIDFRGLN